MQLPDTKHVEKKLVTIGLRVMEFNAIFNNISITLWQSALFVVETRVHRENH
jgi:hypothetical protein